MGDAEQAHYELPWEREEGMWRCADKYEEEREAEEGIARPVGGVGVGSVACETGGSSPVPLSRRLSALRRGEERAS